MIITVRMESTSLGEVQEYMKKFERARKRGSFGPSNGVDLRYVVVEPVIEEQKPCDPRTELADG